MPRDLNGNYSLPAGNPVVTGTEITSTWANGTLDDVANELTDSMSRSGKGGFTAPIAIVDGTAPGPGIGFINEPSTGLYRAGPGDMRVTLLGTAQITFDDNGITLGERVSWADYSDNPYGLATVSNTLGTSNGTDLQGIFTDEYGQLRILSSNDTDRIYGSVIGAVGTNAALAETVASFATHPGQDMTQLILEDELANSKPQFIVRHQDSVQRNVFEISDQGSDSVVQVNGRLGSTNLLSMFTNNVEEHRLTSTGDTLNRTGTYAAFSDLNLKQVTGSANSKTHLALLNELVWRKGYLLDDPTQRDMLFVIAQEVEARAPGLIIEGDDGIKGVRYSVIAMMAASAIKELTARIEVLENAT